VIPTSPSSMVSAELALRVLSVWLTRTGAHLTEADGSIFANLMEGKHTMHQGSTPCTNIVQKSRRSR
jgi:hypothetical protein